MDHPTGNHSRPLHMATSANIHVDGTNVFLWHIEDDICVEGVTLTGSSNSGEVQVAKSFKGPWGYDICSNAREEYHKQEKGCSGLKGH